MKKVRYRIGLFLVVAALTVLVLAKAQERTAILVIRGGTLIDGTGAAPRKGVVIVVRGDKIDAVGAEDGIPEGAKVIDAAGKFILPSLLDARVRIGPTPGNHLSRREVGIEQRLDSLRALLTAGVTTARLIQGSLLEQELYQRWAQGDLLVAPKIVTSGPVFTARGGHPIEEYSVLAVDARDRETRQIAGEDEAREKAREVAHAEADSFEVMYDQGPEGNRKPRIEKSTLEILVGEARGHNLPIFCEVGSDQEAADAAEGGVNALEGVWDAALSENTLSVMARKGVYLVPALTQQGDLLDLIDKARLKAYLDSALVQQSLSNVMKQSLGSDTGTIPSLRSSLSGPSGESKRRTLEEQRQRAFENVRKARERGVKVVVGTGAGSVLIFPGASVHRELQLLVRAGLTPMEAIVAATQNTAASLGRDEQVGTVQVGKRADLLILDADPLADIRNTEKIYAVIRDGQEFQWADYPPR